MNILIVTASAINIQRVMRCLEIIKFTGGSDNFFNSRITEFNNFTRIHVYQVVMLHTTVCFFKLRNIFSELVLYNKTAVEQQFNGII